MVGFRDLVGTDFAPVSNKSAVKELVLYCTLNYLEVTWVADIFFHLQSKTSTLQSTQILAKVIQLNPTLKYNGHIK